MLDRMAAEGMRFTDFYSAAEVCTPSRAALLRVDTRFGAACAQTISRVAQSFHGSSGRQEITLAEALKASGYATGLVGKWQSRGLVDQTGGASAAARVRLLPGFAALERYGSHTMAPKGAPGRPDQDPEWWNAPLYRNEELIEQPADQTKLTRRYTEEAQRFLRVAPARTVPAVLRPFIPARAVVRLGAVSEHQPAWSLWGRC